MIYQITFKRDPAATGLARIGADAPSVALKVRGREFGKLRAPASSRLSSAPGDGWSISLMITRPDGSGWDWRRLKVRFQSEEEGRRWVADHNDMLQIWEGLHFMEKD